MAKTKTHSEQVQTGQQGTDEPWLRPGQTSQDRSLQPPDREERERQYERMGRDAQVATPPNSSAYQKPLTKRIEDRPTEDDLAQAALGGPKGSPQLPPAPLTKTEEEQNLPNDEPGHVA
jgi:hypothetical protein